MTFIKKSMTTSKGFTLIELMLVVAVVGILAAIAMPAYSGYIQKSRRTDATVAIRAVQFAQEKYRGNNTSYGSLTDIGMPATTESGYYTIAVSSATATGYVVTATAVSGKSQSTDSDCTSIQLQQAAGSITTTPSACWSK